MGDFLFQQVFLLLVCVIHIPKSEDGGIVEISRETRALHNLLYLADRERCYHPI